MQRQRLHVRPTVEILEERLALSHKPGHGGGIAPPPPTYTLTDLGVLSGHDNSHAFDVNSDGLVVGQSLLGGASSTARAYVVAPRDVNNDGKLDWYANAGNVGNSTNDLMIALTTISGPTFSHSIARGINEKGQVVGAYHTPIYQAHAFLITPRDTNGDGKPDLWNQDANGDGINDLMTDLGALGGTRSTAMGINDKGQVVGWAQDAAGNMFPFLWNPDVANGATGQMINLGTFGIPTNREFDSIAMGINEAGQVVGKVVLLDATGSYWYTRGFVVTPRDVDGDGKLDWNHDANGDGKNDLMVDLGTLGYVSSNANAINDSGVIVGEAGSNLSMIWGHAARWTPQSGGWTITDLGGLHGRLHHSIAYDINNAGGIVGYSQEMVRTLWGSGGIAGYEAIGERRAYVHDGQIKAVDSLVAGMAGFTYLNEAKAISDNRFIVGEGKVGAARHAFVAVPIVSPLVSDRAGPGNAAELTMTQVESIAVEALTRWVARSGAKPDALLDIRIADLPGATLGLASGATIWLDIDAAGWGWFVDSTPWDDSEFTTPGDQGEQNRMDLVTVLTHEIGHVFGLDHEDDGVMAETLTAGTRQMPDDGLRDGELIAVWETLAHESGKRR